MALPPGPRIPGPVQTYLIWAKTTPFLDSCHRRYGDVFTVKAAGWGDLVYLADPDAIKEVFTGSGEAFHAGEANAFLGDILGPSSVLLLDDDRHLRTRRLMLPPFHGESVQRYGEVVAELTAHEVARWEVGRPLALHPRMQAITLEVILRAVMGIEDHDRLAELRPLLRRLVDLKLTTQLLVLWPALGKVGPWRRFRELQARVDALLYEEIARRRRAPREDILSLLVQAEVEDGVPLTDAELRDQLITLLAAGHETTATGLAWAFERLLRNPAALRRLVEDPEDDAWLDAVVKETLRVRPVIADVVRKLTRDVRVAGHDLPAGAFVAPGIHLVQHDARHWPDPHAFRPERFLDGSPAPYTWIPFGGGVRRCLGASFATFEMKTVLRTVLDRVELRAPRHADEGVRVRHVTQIPKRGAEAVVSARRAPGSLRPAAAAAASA